MLETAYLLNPGTRRRRARRAKGRRARRRNQWFGASRRHAAAARKGHRRKRRTRNENPRRRRRSRRRVNARKGRRRRRRNLGAADYFGVALNPRRRRRSGRGRSRSRSRRRNPGGALALGGMKLGFPEVIPGVKLPLPGVIGTVVNGAIQGVIAGGIVFAGYFGSGALVNYVVSAADAQAARAAGNKFKGYWARPLLFAGSAAVLGGIAAALAPKSKKLMWSLLAAAGPAVRAFGGVIYALLGDEGLADQGFKGDMTRLAAGLADYIQTDDLYEAGMGQEDEDEGMEDYLQVGSEDGTEEMADLYEAGMGAEEEVIGI